jgi:predicted ATP-grasp superfamily ATP-dependent carboligase
MRLLIAGASTRAAAESAARAGLAVTALDAYADLDQHADVNAMAVRDASGGFADALARAAQSLDVDAVVYLSPFENHPEALAALKTGRRLLGNDVDVLKRVRDPLVVQQGFADRGIAVPRVIASPSDPRTLGPSDLRTLERWLVKPVRSGGGHGVRRADVNQPLEPGWYLQGHIDGWPGSVTFVASQGRCVVLAVSRQLVGEKAFGAEGYRYCGSLVSWETASSNDDASLRTSAPALASAATDAFGLVGVNGLDVIVRNGIPMPIELNPRWCSSMELVDRASRIAVMDAHVKACDGALVDDLIVKASMPVTGKAIVFARTDVVMPDTTTWLGDADVRDIPQPHQRIARGQPICTVFAEGATPHACHAALVQRADNIYARVEQPASS